MEKEGSCITVLLYWAKTSSVKHLTFECIARNVAATTLALNDPNSSL